MVQHLTDSMGNMDTNLQAIRNEVTGLKSSIEAVENKLDDKIEGLRQSMNKEINSLRVDFKAEIRTKVDDGIKDVRNEVKELREQLETAQDTIERVSALVETPFHSDRSVVVYGMANENDQTDEQTVEYLLNSVLKLEVTPKTCWEN